MNIHYISLGSFCHPKIFIRNTKRKIGESLPFDFHSSPNTYSIYNILKSLHENKTYVHKFNKILFEHDHNHENKKQLAVQDDSDMFFLHFFDINDLTHDNIQYPASIDFLDKDKIKEIQQKFKKRYKKLYSILNDESNILVFLRIENYKNPNWKDDLRQLTDTINLFKNQNKFLIYTQKNIDHELDFYNQHQFNYNYSIPVMLHSYEFDEKISSNEVENKKFSNLIESFENIIDKCVYIDINNVIKTYYFDNENLLLVQLDNIDTIIKVIHLDEKYLEIVLNDNIYIFLKNNLDIYCCIS